MPLSAGTMLGPYEILAPIGAGGMGEVYKARDARLGRDVALKILPAAFANDADRVRRFEQEARAAAALNHPNIVIVHDVGSQDGMFYVATELLEGETLRERLASAALPVRKAVDYAIQIARGLAAAHAKGIVHRDLKPENLFLTKDGHLKILDFGLAKQSGVKPSGTNPTELATEQIETNPGMVLGTAGYMSPEQVRGQAVDHRADIFSFGAILYEMLMGQRAFGGQSSAEIMGAILRDDPPALPTSVPPELGRIVNRCLAKEPAQRYQSAADLAFALQPSVAITSTSEASSFKQSRQLMKVVTAVGLLALVAMGGWFWRGFSRVTTALAFQQLTFRDGYIDRALFQPDGTGFIFTAKWTGEPPRTFAGRIGDPQTRALPLAPGSRLTALSSSGELAIDVSPVDPFGAQRPPMLIGQPMLLARVPPTGGPHREIAEKIQTADWAPDGSSMAVVRTTDRGARVEYPIGHKLFEDPSFLPSFIRISRDGKLVATEGLHVDSSFHGEVGTLDRSGRYTAFYKSPVGSPVRMSPPVWSPNGSEIWFASLDSRDLGVLYAVNMFGSVRELARLPGSAVIDDVDRNGRMLIALADTRADIVVLNSAGKQVLPWFGGSSRVYLTRDARTVVFMEESRHEFGRAIYSRSLDGTSAVKLSDGFPIALSPSGGYVIAWRANADPSYVIVPTGAGEERPIQIQGYDLGPGASMAWLSGEKEIVLRAHLTGHDLSHLIVYSLDTGAVRNISPELNLRGSLVAAADGNSVFAQVGETWTQFKLPQGTASLVKGIQPQESILSGAADGRRVYIGGQTESGVRFIRLDPATGTRTLLREGPEATLRGALYADVSGDGQTIAYVNTTIRSTLYLVTGIR